MKYISIAIIFFLIINTTCGQSDSKVINYQIQHKNLLRFDGYYIMNQLWPEETDSVSTTFFFCENGSAACISTYIDSNPISGFKEMSDTEKKHYQKSLKRGVFEVVNDTVFVKVSWNMYGILGGKEYNHYWFVVSNDKLKFIGRGKDLEKLNIQNKTEKKADVARFILTNNRPSCK